MADNPNVVCWPLPVSLRPPGYPDEFERIITLRDGRSVFIRPIAPTDASVLRDEIRDTDAETLYKRFFTTRPRVDSRRLRDWTQLDYRCRFALIAIDKDQRGIGIVRYVGMEGVNHAELSCLVRPQWRQAGLATVLLRLLEEAAQKRGLQRFTAYYLADNAAAAGLLTKMGFSPTRILNGVAESEKIFG